MLNELSISLKEFLMSAGIWAPLISSLLIVVEGTLAFLPLVVFITINMLTMGPILGGIVSWTLTVVGSYICFSLFRLGLSKFFNKKISKSKKLSKFQKKVDKIKFNQLVLLISIPFVPSFFVNMAAGLSNISRKKYVFSLILGKIFVVLFYEYLGYSVIDCLTNPISLLRVVLLLVVSYAISKIINKKFDIDERF